MTRGGERRRLEHFDVTIPIGFLVVSLAEEQLKDRQMEKSTVNKDFCSLAGWRSLRHTLFIKQVSKNF